MPVSAIDALEKTKWGDHVRCCFCWGLYATCFCISKWRRFKCSYCGKYFTVVSDTFFEQSDFTADQINQIVILHSNGQLNLSPFRIAKKVGTYPEKIKKLITEIKDLSSFKLMNVPQIVIFEALLRDLKSDMEFLPFFRLMFMYKIKNLKDEKALSNISGLNITSVQVALLRMNLYWSPGEVFEEDKGFNWHKWDDWYGEILKPLLTIHLHAMCLTGIIMRNPETRMYYIG